MLTSARIEQVLKPQSMDWVRSLARADRAAGREALAVQPSLFDERNPLELSSQDFPGAPGDVSQPSSGRGARTKAAARQGRSR